MKSFEEVSPTPHVLVELSDRELKRITDNCIHLKGVESSKSNGDLLYSSVTYGANIKKRKSRITVQGDTVPSYEISIHTTKRQLFLITVPKTDAMVVFPQLLTSASTYNDDPSGVLVLMACISKPIPKFQKHWNADDYKRVKKCKPNILQNSNHHQSTGYYASFGNKGSYETINASSVGQYNTKKHSILDKQVSINQEATLYETYCANEISRSVKDLGTFLPNIRNIIAPVIETSFNLQSKEGKDLNLKEMSSITEGCWQTSICIDAETREYHTEHDCTYTLISIPTQKTQKKNQTSIKYDFLFKLTNKQSINVTLKPGVSFIFSGLFLSHRQNKSRVGNTGDEHFFNMASYGNKRLFQHLRKTYNKK